MGEADLFTESYNELTNILIPQKYKIVYRFD